MKTIGQLTILPPPPYASRHKHSLALSRYLYTPLIILTVCSMTIGCTSTAPLQQGKVTHESSRSTASAAAEPITLEEANMLRQHIRSLEQDLHNAEATEGGNSFKIPLSSDGLKTFLALGVGIAATTIAVKAFLRNISNILRTTKTTALLASATVVAGISFRYIQQQHPDSLRNVIIVSRDALTDLWSVVRDLRSGISNGLVMDELGIE